MFYIKGDYCMTTMTLQEFAKVLTLTNTTQQISNVEIIEDEYTTKRLMHNVSFQDSLQTRQYDIECILDKLFLKDVILKNVNIRFKQRIELNLMHCTLANVKLFDESCSSSITLYNYSSLKSCTIHSFDNVDFEYASLQNVLIYNCAMLCISASEVANCGFFRCISRTKLLNSIFTNCQFAECTFRAYTTRDVTFDNCEYRMSPCFYQHCPETGSYIAYKKAAGKPHSCIDFCIIKLLIPEDAKRSSSLSSKCRASKAIVLDIFNLYDESKHLDTAYSFHDAKFIYHINDTVEVTDFENNRWEECAPGIHHFLSKQEAIDYSI